MSAQRCEQEQAELEALASGDLDAAEAERVSRHVAGCQQCAGELAWLRAEQRLLRERARAEPPLADSLWAGIESRLDRGAEPARALHRDRGLARWLQAVRARWVPIGFTAAATAAALILVWVMAEPAMQPAGGERAAGERVAGERAAGERAAGERAAKRAGGEEAPPAAAGGPARSAQAGETGGAGAAPAVGEAGLAEAERAVAEAERAHLAAIAALERAYAERRGRLDAKAATQQDQELRRARDGYALERVAASDLDSRMLLLDAYAEHRRLLQSLVQELEERNQ